MRRSIVASMVVAIVVGTMAPAIGLAQEEQHKENGHQEDDLIRLTDRRRLAAGIETAACERRTLPILVHTTGVVDVNADRVAHLGSRLPGIVLDVSNKGFLGTLVEENDPLVVVHSLDFGKAQVEYRRTIKVLDLRQKTFDREKDLFERKISSGREYAEAEADLAQAKIDIESAGNQLEILGLTSEEIEAVAAGKAPLGRMTLRAPIRGTLIEKHLVKGEHVDTESSLFTIADLERIWIFADIYERELALIGKGQKAEIHLAAYPETTFGGRIAHVAETIDVETRTLKVRIEVENKEGKLKPGMFAEVDIAVGERPEAVVVPDSALQAIRQASIVFVEEDRNVFERRPVRTGVRFGGVVEILEGLQAGEKVVTSGGFLLKSEIEKEGFEAGHGH
ncbi:MAG: hypothetical protein A2Z34_07915 [Planctomycetes bacterium RBG_16_59_8]|nr:MAG: hypothetical protein A2Z34_07915 [Planctomycetes bacterium RBG_16_59_8]